MRFVLLPAVLLLIAAGVAPADNALRDRVIAGARSQPATALNFERTTHVVEAGGGTRTETKRIDRWDGRGWTLLSINGKQPGPSDLRKQAKLVAREKVPGYHHIAELLSGATESHVDAQGRVMLSVPQLPPGTVTTNGTDISSHLKADCYIATRNGQPWVQQLRLSARESFQMGWIKVLTFDQISDYKLDSAGNPRLASQSADSQGTLLGISGGQKSEITYAYP